MISFLYWFFRSKENLYNDGYNEVAGSLLRGGQPSELWKFANTYHSSPEFRSGMCAAINDWQGKEK